VDLPLDDVPLIFDFFLTLREADEGGLHVELMSESQGHLAGFPAWDHADRDLRHFTHDDIPLGDDEEPYADADENWRIVIVARANDVFVLEGDSPRGPLPRRYRIPREHYMAAWDALIRRYHSPMSLEDVMGEDAGMDA
jgi:hypothetical protein